MFIETHKIDDKLLTFIKSANVQAFPCGRRRSKAIDLDGDTQTTPNDIKYIPFDPEARLNTEANNRKHSSLNGFTQTYLKDWDETNQILTVSLAGYLFTIKLATGHSSENSFGGKIIDALITKVDNDKSAAITAGTDTSGFESELADINEANYIYANILTEDVHLFSGFNQEYFTGILRNQSTIESDPETSIDLLKTDIENSSNPTAALADAQNFNNYYFSGLSFSVEPLTGSAAPRNSIKRDDNDRQQFVSLCILEKVGDTWKVHEPARLPFIEHDVDKDSVVMGETHVRRNLTVDEDADITGNLVVGTEENQNSSITIHGADLDEAHKALIVEGAAKVTKDLVVDETFEVTDKFTVNTDGTTVKNVFLANENVVISKDLAVGNGGAVGSDTENTVTIHGSAIIVNNLTVPNATITNINGDDIQQKVGEGDNYYDVPVMFIEKDTDDKYQLKLCRVNKVNF